MTLNHSKTWPVSTLAVVQLRVDPHRKTYSAIPETDLDSIDSPNDYYYYSGSKDQNLCPSDKNEQDKFRVGSNDYYLSDSEVPNLCSKGKQVDNYEPDKCLVGENGENGNVLPLSEKHLEIFTKMSMRKTTIRTDTISTLLDPTEFDSEKQDETERVCEAQDQEDPKPDQDESDTCELQKFHVLALTRIDENVNESECVVHGIGRRPSIKVDNWDFIYTETVPINNQGRCPIHCCNPSVEPSQTKDTLLPDLPLDARKTTTLRRHYYPEGGWGWVVVVCSVLVHVLNHGVQLACSQLVIPGSKKFKVDVVHFSGANMVFVGQVTQPWKPLM